jgi:hypothetical protein
VPFTLDLADVRNENARAHFRIAAPIQAMANMRIPEIAWRSKDQETDRLRQK